METNQDEYLEIARSIAPRVNVVLDAYAGLSCEEAILSGLNIDIRRILIDMGLENDCEIKVVVDMEIADTVLIVNPLSETGKDILKHINHY